MAKSNKTNFDRHLERELKNPKFVKGFCEELEKTRLAIKKSIKDSFKNTILKAGVLADRVYKESKEQLEKKQVKRKKITNELLELSKHTHPVSTKQILGELRNDRQK